jgi:hypothetical protein
MGAGYETGGRISFGEAAAARGESSSACKIPGSPGIPAGEFIMKRADEIPKLLSARDKSHCIRLPRLAMNGAGPARTPHH